MSFFEQLKRRRVIRAATLYAAAAYATLQVTDVLMPALLLPEWTLRLVAFLLLLGAPTTLVLAWFFDLTPDGLVTTSSEATDAARVLTPGTLLVAVGLVGLGLGAGWLLGRSDDAEPNVNAEAAPAPGGAVGSLAVLPFQDLSADGDQANFADGIAEEIMRALGRAGLRVSARTSSFAFRDRAMDARAIGDSLGVRAVLEGSLRKDGERLRFQARLVDVADGFTLWTESYDRRMTSVFEVQEEIARAIVGALEVPLGLASDEALVPHRTEDVDAYSAYLEARERFNVRGRGVRAAIELLESVVARDPDFAPAWALMAEAYAVWAYFTGPEGIEVTQDWDLGTTSIRRAQEAAERALALDSLYAPAHAAMGTVARERLDWAASERHLRRAIELDPEYAEAHSNLGEILFALDRPAEAREHHLHAVELEPRNWIYRYNMGWLAYQPILNEATVEHLREAVRIAPTLWAASRLLALNYALLDRYAEARGAVEEQAGLPESERAALLTVIADMETGRRTEEGSEAIRNMQDALPSFFLLYGDTAGAARQALDLAARYPYHWGGFLGGLPELAVYPDFREARRRKGLPVPSAVPGR